jgi:hypothetical protein
MMWRCVLPDGALSLQAAEAVRKLLADSPNAPYLVALLDADSNNKALQVRLACCARYWPRNFNPVFRPSIVM